MTKVLTYLLAILAVIIPPLMAVAQVGSCDATTQYYFGPNCLNPWNQPLPNYYPIGSYVEFYRPDNSTDIGRVTGYSWQVLEQRYAYYVATSTIYVIVPNGISGVNEVVKPEQVYFASELPYGR